MKQFSDTFFFRLGAMKFSESFDGLTKLTDVCTYDATMYATNEPKYCMIRKQETTFRPHLVRHLNLLDDEMRNYIQRMWDASNTFVQSIGIEPYQCFLVISSNRYSVPDHTHGDHMGDTITVVSSLGNSVSDTYLCLGDNTRLKYPEPNEGNYAVCFDGNIVHSMDAHDDNYYFHFVYDLTTSVDFPKNIWIKL
jgi:hypothetical protein